MSLLNRALGMGRSLAAGRMTETVTVGLFDDDVAPDGSPIRVPVTTRYTGRARVKYPSLAVIERQEPSQVVAAREPMLSVPVGTQRFYEGDEVQVTASTADSVLVGRTYRVAGAPQAGQTTSHRYPLVEL